MMQTNTELKNYFIKSQKVAGYLMQRGFVLCGMKPDLESIRNIFIFKNSYELISAINDYKQHKETISK